jgi:hypothetical protein
MNVNYEDKSQEQEYDPLLWNAQDANEVKNAVNSKADLTALAAKADVSALSAKADITALVSKADKINGVVPLSQLPEAVLNINQFEVLSDGTIGIRTSYLQSLGLTTGGGGTNPTNPTNPGDTNTTPSAPILSADDVANILVASHALGDSEIVVSTNNSSYVPYTPIIVGDIARAAGYWKFKIKAATGRNESSVVNSPAFTVAQAGNVNAAAPTNGVVSDSQNTFGFTLVSGIALSGNYEYTLNGGTTVANVTVNPINVGNLAYAIGQVGVRVKAATGRNASAWLFNTSAFTVSTATPSTATPITAWHGLTNGIAIDANSFNFTTPQGSYGYVFADKKIAAGTNGFIQFDGIVPAAPNSSTAILTLSNVMDATHGHDMGINAWYTNSNKIVSRIGGVWNDSAWTAAGVNTKIRLRVDATTAYVESSVNNGVDWIIVRDGVRPDGDLYIRAFAQVAETNLIINNIYGSGLV